MTTFRVRSGPHLGVFPQCAVPGSSYGQVGQVLLGLLGSLCSPALQSALLTQHTPAVAAPGRLIFMISQPAICYTQDRKRTCRSPPSVNGPVSQALTLSAPLRRAALRRPCMQICSLDVHDTHLVSDLSSIPLTTLYSSALLFLKIDSNKVSASRNPRLDRLLRVTNDRSSPQFLDTIRDRCLGFDQSQAHASRLRIKVSFIESVVARYISRRCRYLVLVLDHHSRRLRLRRH